MTIKNIKLNPIKFGDDNRGFSIDREHNAINQTMTSIKNMQKISAQILYEMSLHKKEYTDLFFIFKDLKNSDLNKTSINILFKLGYFNEYGDVNYIINQWNIYNDMCSIFNRFKDCKQLKKSECIELGLDTQKIEKFCNKTTDKMFKEIDNEAICDYLINNLDVYKMLLNRVSKNYSYEPITKLETIIYEICYNGYTELIDETAKDNLYIITELETNQYGTIFCTLYQIKTGKILKLKINKYSYNEHPCEVGDVIKTFINIQAKTRLINDGWVKLDEKEEVLKNYSIVKKFE